MEQQKPKIRKKEILSISSMLSLFIIAQVIAIAITPTFQETGIQAFPEPEKVENAFIYIAIILVFTAIILFIAKRGKQRFIQAIILIAVAGTMVYVFYPLFLIAENYFIEEKEIWEEEKIGNTLQIIINDIDNDSVKEIITLANNEISIFTNNSKKWKSEKIDNLSFFALSDLNNDGKKEIIANSNNIIIFNWSENDTKFLNFSVKKIAIGDVNNDGIKEIVCINNSSLFYINTKNFIKIYEANLTENINSIFIYNEKIFLAGNWIFIYNSSLSNTKISNISYIIVDDLNNDKKEEIVVYNKEGFYILDDKLQEISFRELKEINGIAMYDFDNDGKKEIASISRGRVYLFEGEKYKFWWASENISAKNIAVDDLNNDGTIEIFVGTEEGYKYISIKIVPPKLITFSFVFALLLSLILTYVLYKFPEWYIVNSVGIIVGAGASAIFGISLAILPVLVLLIALAIYDFISVYKTKHMIDLADSVMELRLPVLLVIPKKRKYSFLKQRRLKEQIEMGEKEAMFMGLGDVVIPTILVISAYRFLPSINFYGFPSNLIVAVCTMVGSIIGFLTLMIFVLRGKPQAGLPLLNSGTIIAYLVSYYIIYKNLTFGISWIW